MNRSEACVDRVWAAGWLKQKVDSCFSCAYCRMSVIRDVDATPRWQLALSALVLILLPEALAIALFSSVGVAAEVATFAADSTMDMAGNGAFAGSVLVLALIFVADVQLRGLVIQILFGILLAACLLATSSLKYISYPWLCTLVCFGFAIFFVACLRLRCYKADDVSGRKFFEGLSLSFTMAGVITLAAWVAWQSATDRFWSLSTQTWLADQNSAVYSYLYENSSWGFDLNFTEHCSVNKDTAFLATLGTDSEAIVLAACQNSETVWFLQWACPCAMGIGNFIVAAVCWVFAQAAASLEVESEDEDKKVKSALKTSTGLVVLMLTVMYAAQYVSGANVTVSSALLALGAASVASIVAFMLLEFGFQRLNNVTQKDRLAKNLMSILKSDWMKAVVVASLNIFIPVMAFLDRIRQMVRKCTGLSSYEGKFTAEGERVFKEMSTWAWCSIFFKVNLLGLMGTALLLGMKLTYVFFSWLNETLAAANLSFAVLCLMILGVALLMFLCPIVPGSAVYLFSGVVLGAQSQLEGSVGFAAGVASGVVVSSCAKMIACTLQYSMGYAAGQLVKVQQFVGVDKVPTRAMEQILKQRGLKIDKVAILVAGPDWPTSVLCGILRMNVPAMLLGTLPVILVSIIPQVLVGALLTYQDDSSGGIMGMISSAVTLAAAVVQALAMFYFTYRIMKVVDEDGEKLAQEREEHKAVAELTRKEQDYVQALREVSEWKRMKLFQKAIVLLSSACILVASFVFIADYSVKEKFCFRGFEITSSIGNPIAQGGLDGNALNLVIVPMGWASLGLALLGFIMHIFVNKWLARDARRNLVHKTDSQPEASPIGKPSSSYSAFKDTE